MAGSPRALVTSRWLHAALAAGDVETALDAAAAAWEHGSVLPGFAAHLRPIIAEAALAGGDLIAARRWADDAVATAPGWSVLVLALTVRARVAIAQGEPEQAERDAHDALANVPEGFTRIWPFPTILECLAALAGDAGSHREAARLFGAARGDPAAHGRGAVQGLGRRLRGLGGGATRCPG